MGRTALLPIASAVGLQVAFSNEDWARVENSSYRRTFSADVREQVQIAWQEYVDEAVFAEPLNVVERKVEKIKKALEKAQQVAHQELTGGSDASFFAGHLISKHLPAPSRSESCDAVDLPPQETGDFFKSMFADDSSLGHRNVSSIRSTLKSNVRACELAENELKELRAQRKADDRVSADRRVWNKLITRLASILIAAGFRVSSRKDKDGVSDFVALNWQMHASVRKLADEGRREIVDGELDESCATPLSRHLRQMSGPTPAAMAEHISKVLRDMGSPKAAPKAATRTARRKRRRT